MSNLKTKIETILAEELLNENLFPVEIIVQEQGKIQIKILLDGDEGITIDECAKISRGLGEIIEENEWIVDTPYVLEVSSSGVGEPLKLQRQYTKNIDRFLDIQLKDIDAKMVSGQLTEVGENSIQILEELPKKGKNKSKKIQLATESTEIKFEQIQRAIVKIMF